MGRPKKVVEGTQNVQVGQDLEQVIQDAKVTEEVKEVTQTEKALGIHFNQEKSTYEIVVIEFSGDNATVTERRHVGDNKQVAISKFKQFAVQLKVL